MYANPLALPDVDGRPFRPVTARDHAAVRAAQPDFWQWLGHVTPAGECTQPDPARRPDPHRRGRHRPHPGHPRRPRTCPTGCSTRRAATGASPSARTAPRSTSATPTSSSAPAWSAARACPTASPPTRACSSRSPRPGSAPCTPGPSPSTPAKVASGVTAGPGPATPARPALTCAHGQPTVCFARHELGDPVLGQPLCLDCYDYDWQAVWNHQAGELWRRTTMAILRAVRRTAKRRGIDPATVKVGFGKVAEMQRRGVVHFHAVLRLDGHDPDDPGRVLPPPDGLVLDDLADAVNHAATTTMFVTGPHPDKPSGWLIGWGTQLDIRTINLGTDGAITDGMVAGYLAKYATKATEATGHTSRRLTVGNRRCVRRSGRQPHRTTRRGLLDSRPSQGLAGLRRWAHMLGFGGHFLTKSRHYSVTFRLLRQERVVWQQTLTAGPEQTEPAEQPTVLVVNFLDFVGAGWHTTGDAMLANTAAAQAREQRRVAREELATAWVN